MSSLQICSVRLPDSETETNLAKGNRELIRLYEEKVKKVIESAGGWPVK